MTAPAITRAVIDAANRIVHMDYPDDLTMGGRLDAFIRDAELVAGAVGQINAGTKP